MKQSSICIQVVANQAGIPFSKAEAMLRLIAYWSRNGAPPGKNVFSLIEGARYMLETLGAQAGAINQAVAAINRESSDI